MGRSVPPAPWRWRLGLAPTTRRHPSSGWPRRPRRRRGSEGIVMVPDDDLAAGREHRRDILGDEDGGWYEPILSWFIAPAPIDDSPQHDHHACIHGLASNR